MNGAATSNGVPPARVPPLGEAQPARAPPASAAEPASRPRRELNMLCLLGLSLETAPLQARPSHSGAAFRSDAARIYAERGRKQHTAGKVGSAAGRCGLTIARCPR